MYLPTYNEIPSGCSFDVQDPLTANYTATSDFVDSLANVVAPNAWLYRAGQIGGGSLASKWDLIIPGGKCLVLGCLLNLSVGKREAAFWSARLCMFVSGTGLVVETAFGYFDVGALSAPGPWGMVLGNFHNAGGISTQATGYQSFGASGVLRPSLNMEDVYADATSPCVGLLIGNPSGASITVSSWRASFEQTSFTMPDVGLLRAQ